MRFKYLILIAMILLADFSSCSNDYKKGVSPGSSSQKNVLFRISNNSNFSTCGDPRSKEYYPEAHKGWAGSNIYWDGSKLTFDDVGDQTHRYYSGLCFCWGSLLAIGYPSDTSYCGVLYSLDGRESSFGYSAWASWAYFQGGIVTSNPPPGKTERDRAYLYEITNVFAGVGDICKYMTLKGWAPGSPVKKWRMPTSNEFEAVNDYSPWIDGSNAMNSYGTANVTAGRKKKDVFFPAAQVFYLDGSLSDHAIGLYWSSSSGSISDAYNLHFSSYLYQIYPSEQWNRRSGFTVRCVAE